MELYGCYIHIWYEDKVYIGPYKTSFHLLQLTEFAFQPFLLG